MLLVSRAQRQSVGDPAFIDRIMQHLRLHYLEELHEIPDEVLRRRVVHCIARGRADGLTFERSLAVFCANMLRINPEFDKQSTIARILADTSRPEVERLEALLIEAGPADWDEAERQCDAEAYWQRVDEPSSDEE
jgi:hypothetical protein